MLTLVVILTMRGLISVHVLQCRKLIVLNDLQVRMVSLYGFQVKIIQCKLQNLMFLITFVLVNVQSSLFQTSIVMNCEALQPEKLYVSPVIHSRLVPVTLYLPFFHCVVCHRNYENSIKCTYFLSETINEVLQSACITNIGLRQIIIQRIHSRLFQCP